MLSLKGCSMDSSLTQRDEKLKTTLEAIRKHITIFDMLPCDRLVLPQPRADYVHCLMSFDRLAQPLVLALCIHESGAQCLLGRFEVAVPQHRRLPETDQISALSPASHVSHYVAGSEGGFPLNTPLNTPKCSVRVFNVFMNTLFLAGNSGLILVKLDTL